MNRSTWEFMLCLCFIPFGWSMFLKVGRQPLQRLRCYFENFEAGDIVLVVENLWPVGRILEEQPNKRDGPRRFRPQTRPTVLKRHIDKM